ncbi:hypothetical protein JW960_00625 [candidate division KSB1 bacterium]|nr:hypothetical protein [candidate division KSB1 bacterium]
MKPVAIFLRDLANFIENGEVTSVVRDTVTIVSLAVGIMMLAGFIGLFTANYLH